MGRWLKKIKNKQYGQAMVEFALTLPIFLIAVLGVIELSRFFLVYSSVYTASREATRFGSSVGEGGVPNYQNCDEIRQVAVNSGWFGGVNAANIDIYYESEAEQDVNTVVGQCGSYDPILGDRLVVEVSADYQPLTPILPTIPVSTTNGRTIMMNIAVRATPIPPPVCADDMKFVVSSMNFVSTSQKNKLYIDIKNQSANANYELLSVTDIFWDNTKPPARYLQSITWGDKSIWVKDDAVTVEPPIQILKLPADTSSVTPTPGVYYFDTSLNRTIPAGSIIRLTYIFDKNVPETFMKFKISFQNLNPAYASCTLSIGY